MRCHVFEEDADVAAVRSLSHYGAYGSQGPVEAIRCRSHALAGTENFALPSFCVVRAGTFASILATLLPRPWRPQALQSSFVAAMRGRGPKRMLMSQTSVAAAFQCIV